MGGDGESGVGLAPKLKAAFQRINFQIAGTTSVSFKGEAVILAGKALDDTNTITEPEKFVPHTETVAGLGPDFAREFPPYSVTVWNGHRGCLPCTHATARSRPGCIHVAPPDFI